MTKIDRYLLRESVPPLLFGLLLYAGLAVISTVVPTMQWIVGAPLPAVLAWLAFQFPRAVALTFPVALVLATLLTLGRLATDNEVVALMAGAVGPMRLARIFFVLGALAAAGSLAMSQWVLPFTTSASAHQYGKLVGRSLGLYTLVSKDLPLGDMTLRFESLDRSTHRMIGVRVEHWAQHKLTLLRADRGWFQGTHLVLQGYSLYVFDFAALENAPASPASAVRQLVRVANRPANAEQTLTLNTALTEKDLVDRATHALSERETPSITAAWRQARGTDVAPGGRRQARVDLQRILADPFANLTLLLVAIPLALRVARSRSVAFGLSLVVTLVWYVFLTFGQLFSQTGALPVWLGPWLGNLVLAVLGVFLLARRVSLRWP